VHAPTRRIASFVAVCAMLAATLAPIAADAHSTRHRRAHCRLHSNRNRLALHRRCLRIGASHSHLEGHHEETQKHQKNPEPTPTPPPESSPEPTPEPSPPPPPVPSPSVSAIAPSSGPETGGTAVVISGTGLAGATAVHFGASAASFTVSSSTAIAAVSPAGAGTADVTVTTPGGTSTTSAADRFSYQPPIEGLPELTWEGFSALNPMPAGRRPGNAASPFNTLVGIPVVLPNSSAMVSWLLSHIGAGEKPIKDIARPGGGPLPMVYASNNDPVVELVASGGGNVNGRKIRIPTQTYVGETADRHITIVLAPADAKFAGETIDLWLAEAESSGKLKIVSGKLGYRNGGTGNITGNLLGGHAVSAHFDAEAGEIRGPELKAGIVPHALTAAVKDTKANSWVYPATGGDGSNTEAASPPTGQRFFLEYSDAEIEALHFKPWKAAVLKALAHYGFYIEDTGNSTTSFRWEGSRMYVPFGAPEPFERIGQEQGVPTEGGKYVFKLYDGIDWSRLRAIAPPA
jgi:IPT/TIG domain